MISKKFYVAPSPIAGLGVFACEDVPSGIELVPYRGLVVTPGDYRDYLLTMFVNKQPVYVDAQDTRYANWTRYINDPRGTGKSANVVLFSDGIFGTVKDIRTGDEVLFDYGDSYEW